VNPNFDEIVGSELTDAERERLLQVHELLVAAGPPPELSPELERTPIPDAGGNVRPLKRKNWGRRAVILIAAALLAFIIFVGGFSAGHTSGASALFTLNMVGGPRTPQAQGQLTVYRPTHGNYSMKLNETGLPALPKGSHYEVYLVRNGKPWGSCGPFTVKNSAQSLSGIQLNAPYHLKSGDSWIVTVERPRESGPGPTALKSAQI
jgi:hypothetical protein